jgi:orotate phosphoribosyltransferase-like protein
VNWHDLLPKDIAVRQQQWERRQRAKRMREAGFMFKEIAQRMNVSIERARQMACGNYTLRPSPVELYMRSGKEVASMADAIKATERSNRHKRMLLRP